MSSIASCPIDKKPMSRQIVILLLRNLQHFSRSVDGLLKKLLEGKYDRIPHLKHMWISRKYRDWVKYIISYYDLLKKFRCTRVVYSVLFQANFLLMFNQIQDEMATLQREHVLTKKGFLISCVIPSIHFTQTILSYSQSQIIDAFFYITEQIDMITYEELPELMSIFDAVYTRMCIFFCHPHTGDVLDDISKRDKVDDDMFIVNGEFKEFCVIYCQTILKRKFFFKIMSTRLTDELPPSVLKADNVLEFFTKDVFAFLGEEALQDNYVACCIPTYKFAGDAEWSRFLYGDANATVGEIIQVMRPRYKDQFYTEMEVRSPRIFEGVRQGGQKGKNCRMCVLAAISKYLDVYYKVPHWMNCILIPFDKMSTHQATVKIKQNRTPLLLQVISRYWVYSNKHIYVTDDIFVAVKLWFTILKEDYKSTLLGINLKKITDKICPNLDGSD